MKKLSDGAKTEFSKIAFASILFLFFLQLFSDFIESVYIFALMTLSLNENVLTVLFFLSPILLIFAGKKELPKLLLVIINSIMVLARVLEPLFDTKLRMIVSGLGVGCFLLFFPAFLSRQNSDEKQISGHTLGVGMVLALCISILFRVLNSSVDISTYRWFQSIGWVLGCIEIIILLDFFNFLHIFDVTNSTESDFETSAEISTKLIEKKKRGKIFGAILGFSCIFLILYFVFSSPVMVTRWTEANFVLITIFLIATFGISAGILIFKPQVVHSINPLILWIWNGLFTLSLVGTILINQIIFPSTSDSYPILVSQPQFFHLIPPFILIILSPVLFIDLILMFTNLIKSKPSLPRLGASFTLSGGLFMLVFVFALVFTSTWGFVPPVSFYLRDQFWSVFLIVSLILMGLVYFQRKGAFTIRVPNYTKKLKIGASIFLGVLVISTITGAFIIKVNPPEMPSGVTSMKILTYNLQQGVNDDATKNYDGQLELIREINADIIGLQESSKIAGNSDVVQYFANKLDMYSYFGPRGVTGTTGVALLSKYPISSVKTLYHYNEDSDRKQTATIEAEITIGVKIFTVYVTHTFGSMEAKSMLVNDTLLRAQGKENVLFVGDFNFRQDSEAYNLTTAVLVDAWLNQWPTGIDDWGVNATRRIDHIFVGTDLSITACRYEDWEETQSDHPACWATISW
ncbi:MAG: endonuclease/exonuclease/phosphatase family protein [Candidatus Lokiarchaeota archaeon]|nr:endonuclease/exonuclease/phosphatase family protein [Candidatus Lokiarchaeota archaeon]